MVGFWVRESIESGTRSRAIIVEDAELLLMKRASDNGSELANLLNTADGLLGEFLNLHLIFTVNCNVGEIDPAITRPGRLVAIRDFRRLRPVEAQTLALRIGISLQKQADYSLAEIYGGASPILSEAQPVQCMGFAQ